MVNKRQLRGGAVFFGLPDRIVMSIHYFFDFFIKVIGKGVVLVISRFKPLFTTEFQIKETISSHQGVAYLNR